MGVDIGKNWLDASAVGLRLHVSNERKGFEELLSAARARKKRFQFLCEPGTYADAFIRFVHAKRCKVSLISGSRMHHFAKATTRNAKHDAIDSE